MPRRSEVAAAAASDEGPDSADGDGRAVRRPSRHRIQPTAPSAVTILSGEMAYPQAAASRTATSSDPIAKPMTLHRATAQSGAYPCRSRGCGPCRIPYSVLVPPVTLAAVRVRVSLAAVRGGSSPSAPQRGRPPTHPGTTRQGPAATIRRAAWSRRAAASAGEIASPSPA